MKKTALFLMILLTASVVFAQQKYALVIGNGAYTKTTKLNNPVNDANDMTTALQGLGFTVDEVLNGSRVEMERAISRMRDRLSASTNTYGFFFYAGHGIQSGGVNYLIPVDADLPEEDYLPDRTISVQAMMDILSKAGNELTMIVLDACRNNPFSWARDNTRGLSMVSAPRGSIIMYATSANSVASDGTGRNGLFTGQLLNNLKTPGLSVQDVFNKTGADVLKVSGGKQHPELSSRYFEASSAYLGTRPAAPPIAGTPVQPASNPARPETPASDFKYTIGSLGPAGGRVFYDKGDSTDGWRYLEAAPAETEFRNVQWGAYGQNVTGTQTGIGAGKRNTELIVAHLNSRSETGRAAQVCADLSVNGFSDWFLPSFDELNLMYENLRRNSIGGFTDRWYWSSSQLDGDYLIAWGQIFDDGDRSYYVKYVGDSVRAVRAF